MFTYEDGTLKDIAQREKNEEISINGVYSEYFIGDFYLVVRHEEVEGISFSVHIKGDEGLDNFRDEEGWLNDMGIRRLQDHLNEVTGREGFVEVNEDSVCANFEYTFPIDDFADENASDFFHEPDGQGYALVKATVTAVEELFQQ